MARLKKPLKDTGKKPAQKATRAKKSAEDSADLEACEKKTRKRKSALPEIGDDLPPEDEEEEESDGEVEKYFR